MDSEPLASIAPIGWPDHLPSMQERFEQVAAAVPDRVAVVDHVGAISYAELDRRSADLAAHIAAGDSQGEPVVILFDHGREVGVGMLAAVRAGRPYTVIDPATPSERMSGVARDLMADTIVSGGAFLPLAERLAIGATRLIDVASESGSRVDVLPAPHRVAGVFYTSGSTGEPKGVMRTQSGIVQRVRYECTLAELTPGWTHSLLFSCSFGASQNDLWCALLNGARVAMYPVATLGVTHLGEWLREHAVTWLHAPVALMRQFLAVMDSDAQFEDVEIVHPSGRLFGSDIDLIRRHVPSSARIYSQFASTETSIASRLVITADMHFGPDDVISVGRDVPGVRVDVVDDQGNPRPHGEEGQLVIASPLLAEGYWRRPEQTAAVFDIDPEQPQRRRFISGDYGRRDQDGLLHFIGRRDDRVKLRGYRVELNAVANGVRALEAVNDAHVALDPRNVDRMVAYVVPEADTPFDPAALRDALGERMPEHQIPSVFVELEVLPLTSNGKLDASRLPDIEEHRSSVAMVPPRTETERLIAEIWAEVLGLGSVGVLDLFDDLGGDSLAAMRVVADVVAQCRAEVPLRELLEHGTVASMAAVVDELEGSVTAIPRAGDGPHPLTHQQQNLWVSEQVRPDGRLNMVKVLDMRGPLDIDALRRALRAVTDRHETLRTVFRLEGAIPVQEILPPVDDPLEIVDMTALAPQQRAEALTQSVQDQHDISFRLDVERPLRVVLNRFDDLDHALVVTTHHIATDRTSTTILLDDLAHLYRSELGLESSPDPLHARYVDFATWQRSHLTDEVESAAITRWTERLRDLSGDLSPLVYSERRPDEGLPIERSLDIDHIAGSGIMALAQAEDTTPFVVTLACLKAALFVVLGRTDTVVATVLSGRDRPEFRGMVGCFITTLPIRSSADAIASIRARVRIERDAALAVLEDRDVPFEVIVGALNPTRQPGRTPYAEVGLNFTGGRYLDFDFGPVSATRRFERDLGNGICDLRIEQQGEEISGRFIVDPTWIDVDVAEQVFAAFVQIAHQSATDPDGVPVLTSVVGES